MKKLFGYVFLLTGILFFGFSQNAIAYDFIPHFNFTTLPLVDYPTIDQGIIIQNPDGGAEYAYHAYYRNEDIATASYGTDRVIHFVGNSTYGIFHTWSPVEGTYSMQPHTYESQNSGYYTDWADACSHYKSTNVPLVNSSTGEKCGIPKLTINIEPLAGGNVTGSGISCNVETSSICQYFLGQGTQKEITANSNCGWTFGSWYDGTLSSTTNPLTVTMGSDKMLTAKFLPVLSFPLSGTLADRGDPPLSFGNTWTYGECPTGTYKKHSGIDLQATASETVAAAHAGTVKAIYTGQHSQWADAIVIENAGGEFTTVYWHIIKYGSLAVNDAVTKGQQIATIADLGSNTHFHFGVRMGAYDSNFSLAGALPQSSCSSNPTYPAFPELFVDPQAITYE